MVDIFSAFIFFLVCVFVFAGYSLLSSRWGNELKRRERLRRMEDFYNS